MTVRELLGGRETGAALRRLLFFGDLTHLNGTRGLLLVVATIGDQVLFKIFLNTHVLLLPVVRLLLEVLLVPSASDFTLHGVSTLLFIFNGFSYCIYLCVELRD